jgi:GNAT superfamily N-acetyltransferase
MEAGRVREVTRWSTEIEDLACRAWGLFDQGELVGHLHLAGGLLHSEMHRVDMGMGIRRSNRRQGGGTLLLETGIEWARNQSTIDWIDLGVFSDNPGAQALYARHGFQVLGRTPDRFRVEGQSLDDISMTWTWLAITSDCPRRVASSSRNGSYGALIRNRRHNRRDERLLRRFRLHSKAGGRWVACSEV